MNMTDLESILDYYKKINARVMAESIQRQTIEDSEEFQACRRAEEMAKLRMEEMLEEAEITDSRELLQDAEKAVLIYMRNHNLTEGPGIKCKLRARKKVNANAVLNALEGDIDMFFTLANVTQKRLQEFAKEMPVFRIPLLECVQDLPPEVASFEIESSSSSRPRTYG